RRIEKAPVAMLRPARQGVMLRHRRLLSNHGNDTKARSPRKEIRPTRARGLAAPGSRPCLEALGGLCFEPTGPSRTYLRVPGVRCDGVHSAREFFRVPVRAPEPRLPAVRPGADRRAHGSPRRAGS